ncbi:MAG: hypothetical protein EOP83_19400 [Verrucomicrobiaceae bacterium]|nr:MAG: hypothetical protein EOP83_19400 [Verrucomicrobiaceae bacterium]
MKVTKVCCQGCGADLQVNASLRFVTCNYCQARLEIVHDSTVTHTNLLESIVTNTGKSARSLRILELQNDLERFEREWKTEQSKHKIFTGKRRPKALPTGFDNFGAGYIFGAFGLLALPVSFFIGGWAPMWAVVLLVSAFCLHYYAVKRETAYKKAEAAYMQRRYGVLQEIEEIRRS